MIALLSLLGGLALVGFGVLAGFQGAVTALIADPLNPGPAIEQADPGITVAFCVLALVVWQFGKTYALFLTLPRAAGRAAAVRFDPKRVSSAVTADLDERLAEIESEVAETRRAVEALERDRRDEHVATYDGDGTEDREPAIDSSDRPALESSRRSASERSDRARSRSTNSTAGGTGDTAAPGETGDGSDPPAGGDPTSENASGRD